MAYDIQLAERIRSIIGGRPDLSEKAMFGGLAFLINGHMSVAASSQGGMLVRVDPKDSDKLVQIADVEPMVMRGHAMKGWLRVDSNLVTEGAELEMWVNRSVNYAATLPPKAAKR